MHFDWDNYLIYVWSKQNLLLYVLFCTGHFFIFDLDPFEYFRDQKYFEAEIYVICIYKYLNKALT